MDEFRLVPHECPDETELWPGCPMCDQILKNPCEFCGYGNVFTSHNGLAHAENLDPDIADEDDVTEEMSLVPHKLWPLYLEMSQETIFS